MFCLFCFVLFCFVLFWTVVPSFVFCFVFYNSGSRLCVFCVFLWTVVLSFNLCFVLFCFKKWFSVLFCVLFWTVVLSFLNSGSKVYFGLNSSSRFCFVFCFEQWFSILFCIILFFVLFWTVVLSFESVFYFIFIFFVCCFVLLCFALLCFALLCFVFVVFFVKPSIGDRNRLYPQIDNCIFLNNIKLNSCLKMIILSIGLHHYVIIL